MLLALLALSTAVRADDDVLPTLEANAEQFMVCDPTVDACPPLAEQPEPEPGCRYSVQVFVMFQFCRTRGVAEVYTSPFPDSCPSYTSVFHPLGSGDWPSLSAWFDDHRALCALGDDGTGTGTD